MKMNASMRSDGSAGRGTGGIRLVPEGACQRTEAVPLRKFLCDGIDRRNSVLSRCPNGAG
ncbi:hypothetical protein BC2230_60362 [Burkholderia cepacia]